MGIGSVTSMNSMPGMQMPMTSPADSKSKSIQNEITSTKQKIQKLSARDELTVIEKTNEEQKLQKEISSLNTELKQHQEEFRKAQQKELIMAQLQEDKKLTAEGSSEDKTQPEETSQNKADKVQTEGQTDPLGTVIARSENGVVILKGQISQEEQSGTAAAKETIEESEEAAAEKEGKTINGETATNTSLSGKEAYAIVSAAASVQQADSQGTVISGIRDGIAVLKGEINQDENRGVDTEKKQAELEKLETKEERARAFQFSVLGEANNAMQASATADVAGTAKSSQSNAKDNAYINAFKFSAENQESQQMFNVSFR